MPLGTSLRRSVPYLYLKAYALSTLVSIFASTPLSRRIPVERLRRWEQLRKRGEERIRMARTGLKQSKIGKRLIELVEDDRPIRQSNITPANISRSASKAVNAAERINRRKDGSLPLPFSASSDEISGLSAEPLPMSSISDVLKRWHRRIKELSEIRKLMKRDDEDGRTFPEIHLDAEVRRSQEAHPSEKSFLAARKARIIDSGAFTSFLRLSPSEAKELDPRDIPTVAIGGSGGGYRAMIGFAAFLQTLQAQKAFDVVSYISGVSGSCWTISSLYTISSLSSTKLLAHYRKVASEYLHPMSRSALDVVARSKRGSYFLLAPLLRKAGSGIVGLGIMDLYATILNSYQLLSRDPHAPARLSRATFQWSKVWERNGLQDGKAPLPILTAVRIVHPAKQPKKRRVKFENANNDKGSAALPVPLKPNSNFHWYEVSPLEFGSSDVGAFIPTWSLGRRSPEISLALILGMVTSAPAGPLSGYISTLLATLPANTIMSNLLSKLNDFVKMSRWERRWGNPIRAADEPNPFYGLNGFSTAVEKGATSNSLHQEDSEWEASGRIKLMDAGVSNNSPSHVLFNSIRKADVIINFDASSDVQSGSGLERMFDFGKDRALELNLANRPSQETSPLNELKDSPVRYAVRINGWEKNRNGEKRGTPDLRMLYCPLLPHPIQPEFNPAKAPWCTSFNLIWNPEQVDTLAKTAGCNAEIAVNELREVIRESWKEKRQKRLSEEKQTWESKRDQRLFHQ